MNYLDFLLLFKKEPKRENKKIGNHGRKFNLKLKFQKENSQYESHCMKLRSINFTTILADHSRPY